MQTYSTIPAPTARPIWHAALVGFLGGLAALLVVGAVAGTLALNYQRNAPARERAALEADLADYAAWYEANTYRRNVGAGVFEGYRDSFLKQYPRLEQYLAWWRGWRVEQPGGKNLFVGSGSIKAILPAEVSNPAALDDYFAR